MYAQIIYFRTPFTFPENHAAPHLQNMDYEECGGGDDILMEYQVVTDIEKIRPQTPTRKLVPNSKRPEMTSISTPLRPNSGTPKSQPLLILHPKLNTLYPRKRTPEGIL